jgi:cell division protein FtsL
MKLRRRFSYEGDRTIADVKMDQVLRSEGSVKDRCHTAEFQYLKANSLPRASKSTGKTRSAKPAAERKSFSRASLLLFAVCLVMLVGMVCIAITNMQLNQRLNTLQGEINTHTSVSADLISLGESPDEEVRM